MNLQEYQEAMDAELRSGYAQIAARFQNVPSDPVERRNRAVPVPPPEQPHNERVLPEDRTIPGPAGAPDLRVRIYTPRERSGTLPAALWIHGGGFTAGTYTQNDALCERFVDEAGCVVASVDYRLA